MARPLLPVFLPLTQDVTPPGREVYVGAHEHVSDACVRQYEVPQGHIVLTLWSGRLHEVVYRTPAASMEAARSKREELLGAYGDGHTFLEVLDNGFGKSYLRSDGERYALWSYTMDFVTVMTKDFRAVKWV